MQVDYPALVKHEERFVTTEMIFNRCQRFDVLVHASRNVPRMPLSSKFRTIYAFEPDIELFMEQMAEGMQPNIYVTLAMLGEQHGPVTYFDGRRIVTVPSLRLDELTLPCDAIIVDDISALRGAADTIAKHNPVLMIRDRIIETAQWLRIRDGTA